VVEILAGRVSNMIRGSGVRAEVQAESTEYHIIVRPYILSRDRRISISCKMSYCPFWESGAMSVSRRIYEFRDFLVQPDDHVF
jgi:hypothetical protein